MVFKPNIKFTNYNQEFPYHYKPILSDNGDKMNKLVMEDEDEEQFLSNQNKPEIRRGRKSTKVSNHLCKWSCKAIMGFLLISGCGLLMASFLTTFQTHGCNSGMSKDILWPFSNPNATTSNYDMDSVNNEELILKKMRYKMLSISLKYIVDFILNNENMDFSCPRNLSHNDQSQNVFRDQLDCQKYYVCNNETGNFSVRWCDINEGFDTLTKNCLPRDDVQLCNDILLLREFNCTYTGLHSYKEDCNHFVVCTKENIAYRAVCNAGDYFDPKLLICLPSNEIDC